MSNKRHRPGATTARLDKTYVSNQEARKEFDTAVDRGFGTTLEDVLSPEKKEEPKAIPQPQPEEPTAPVELTPMETRIIQENWWINPQSSMQWIATYLLENLSPSQARHFFRYMCHRSRSEAIIEEVGNILARANPAMRRVALALVPQTTASLRQAKLEEQGMSVEADRLSEVIRKASGTVDEEMDKADLPINEITPETVDT